VADWRYGPNAEGLRFLVEQVAPRLDRQLVLAGRGSEVVGGLGFVEDLDPLYDAAALVVSPVVRGAGTQLKVIEALTRGRVVVSTSYGMRSVPQVAQDGCVVADGSTDMSRAVMRLVDDVDDRHRREAHLRAAAIPRSWSEATAGLPRLISEVRRG
jgi:glycosyltransferase involved in cell wall biosynthesis